MLTIAYSTLANRLGKIALPDLSGHQSWEVLITVQSGNDSQPDLSSAPGNVQVLGFSGAGVSKIRNKSIENAKTRYLVFADDDIEFDLDCLALAVEKLKSSGAALLLGMAQDETGKLRKRYPDKAGKLNKFNSAKAATYEMVVDLEQIKAKGIRFDENFGAGAKENYLGDEYIFICDLISAGLSCVFEPIVLATHPSISSGSGWGTDRDRKARAVVFDRAFRGNRTLPYLARIGFGARKLGKELTLGNYFKFIFKR